MSAPWLLSFLRCLSAASADEGLAGSGYTLVDPPAITALDRAGVRFDEPSSPTDFSVTAGNFVAEDGTLKAGGAAELGARALGLLRKVSATDYAKRPGIRTLGHSYLSLATAAEDNGDLRSAVGLRVVLFDGADPLLAPAYKAAADAARKKCEPLREGAAADALTKYADCIKAAYATEALGLGKSDWNAPGLVLSTAWTSRFPDGELSGFGSEAASAWLSAAGPVGPAVQAGGAVAWSQGLADDAPNELGLAAMTRFGVKRTRFRVESGPIFTVSEPGGWRLPVLVGSELGFGEEVWVSAQFGLVLNPGEDRVSLVSNAAFKWGQASKPSFKPE
jgi:hypothetical protein